ncbi:hypothetical protein [Paenarthrobacter ureafaciens]|uniref:hypothetical protein n=2 Tax=Paenarthrobacter ureafaciens TaxID=37931 RepID=UPI002554D981|nr:hypothetical protein [Paenarthrobacter ureafaciens]
MEVNTLYKDLMFSVLRLVTTRKDGDGNVGTCLIVDLEVVPGSLTPVLVTNRHVLEHAVEISIHLTASEGPRKVALGHTVQVRMELEGDRFFSTDDDVDIAIIPFGAVLREFEEQYPGYKPFWRSLPVSEFPSEEEYASLDALEDVFFLGFPDGRWDSVNQTPIIRRGVSLCFWSSGQCGFFLEEGAVFEH